MSAQRTLRHATPCTGIGLHSGQKVSIVLKPAPVNHGIRFQRTDLRVEIPATTACLVGAQHLQTGLRQADATVETIEHLLSALRSLGVDNAIIELNQPEVPIMDGSASPWVYLIQSTGTKEQSAPRQMLEVLSPVDVQDGDKRIAVYPSDRFKITYSIAFDHPLLRHQEKTIDVTEATYVDEIAPARTFGFLKDVELMRQRGLALGGSLDNAIVIGETGVLNQLRFDDEFVRHKMLDVIGDLALVGHPIRGHVVVQRGGHALHTKFATELLRQRDAWRLVDASEPAAAPVAARVPARSSVR
ncbi:MAG: UDP-3-O-acyl-N-acetylglucosamine deacetylase [Acidimicrobiia bacterium]|nr:UDP-3-O-acyl-N-acetylglucosamine deacetylase [Acidimicrobiia bacterium]